MDPAAIAEDGPGYVVLTPGEVRETRPDVILTHSPVPMPEFGSACRIRFGPSVDGPVAMVREWFAARGREEFVWLVGPSTTPADLDRRLLDLGAEPNPGGSDYMAMVLDHEPPPSPTDIELRRVETFADYTAMWEVQFEGFGMPDEERAAIRATLRERWAATADDPGRWAYLALVDGVPVAEGSVRRTVHGPLWLAGGVTLPAFRGRGIYRALVRARWDDAVRLGASALVVIANVETSYPILERLGFRAVGGVRLLADRSATPRHLRQPPPCPEGCAAGGGDRPVPGAVAGGPGRATGSTFATDASGRRAPQRPTLASHPND
jgi:predicted N-acetyltransferase YhbS